MIEQPRMKPPEPQRIPGLPVGLMQRIRSIPRWVIFLAVAAAIPIATLPVGALARYTTTSPSFCLSCHATGETPDRAARSIVHANFDQVTCVDCHAKQGQVVFEGYVRGFMAEPDRITLNCVRCHDKMTQTNEQSDFKKDFLGIRITHRSHLERGATCTICHSNVAHDLELPQTNRPRMQACNTCHAVSDSCAKCHTNGVPAALPPVPVAGGPAESMADGRVNYIRVCAACHGAKGNLLANVDLSRRDVLDGLGDDAIAHAIAQGKGSMPPFGQKYGGSLNDEQIHSIVGYLDSEAADATAPDGKALYNRSCVVCHGESGDKIAGVQHSSADFWNVRSVGALSRAISYGQGAMPALSKAFGGPLTQPEIRAIIDYLEEKTGVKARQAGAGPDGEAIYQQQCVACHGATGRQVPSANLASKEFIAGLGDDALSTSIAQGKGGMPGFGQAKGGKLGDPEIAALAEYTKVLAGLVVRTAKPADTSQGMMLYTANCAGCHGANGSQIASGNLSSPALYGAGNDGALIKATAEGRGGMPPMGKAKGGPLSDDQVGAIIAYLKSAARGQQ